MINWSNRRPADLHNMDFPLCIYLEHEPSDQQGGHKTKEKATKLEHGSSYQHGDNNKR